MKSFKLLKFGPQWLLNIVDSFGMIQGEVNLNKQKVEHLISLINTASEQGAPWSKYVVSPTSRNGK
jgi:hypothetical protein